MARRKTHFPFTKVGVAVVLMLNLAMYCAVDLAGGSSEIGNGVVVGKIVDSEGNPANNTIVRILPSEYDWLKKGPVADNCTDTTNADGVYRLPAPHGQRYTIQAVQMTLRTRGIVREVVGKDAVFDAPQCTLRVAGAVTVELPVSINSSSGYVYVPGLDNYVLAGTGSGSVTLDSLPAGLIPAIVYTSTIDSYSAVLRFDVRVSPGDTTVVYNPLWRHAQRLFLNTTPSGADVSGDVFNFPVLVRLTAGNFNFSQLKPDGSDLVLTNAIGEPLDFEIARWDTVNGEAEVWVKVDTIWGNNTSQYMIMHWGNPSAVLEKSGTSVFDSAAGFEGVWHLGETSGGSANDASYTSNSGIYHGSLPNGVRSPTGIGQDIVHSDSDYIDIGNVLNPGEKNISISVWLKRRSMGTQQALVAKTSGEAPTRDYGYLLTLESSNFPRFYLASGGTLWTGDSAVSLLSSQAIADSSMWHQVFVVINRTDNKLCRMYIDGIDRTGSIIGNVTTVLNVTNVKSLRIGTEYDNNCSYTGTLGEVTISFTTRSQHWVKLAYMNQKENGSLVVFGGK